ncbi:MAG: DUF3789 domain-containing protein [Ruminococcus sp.]|nr:DUF3789 domain-containing protein [Ruminococcus sp.]MCR5708257.1 DUF3789 domain-containing protein [Ruminococcus sp.]
MNVKKLQMKDEVSGMLNMMIGAFIGGTVSLFSFCLCAAAKQADTEMLNK